MTVNEVTRLTIFNDRVTKNEEAMVKHAEFLKQLTTAHVTLARDHTKVAQSLDLMMERLIAILMHQKCEIRKEGRSNELLPVPNLGRQGLRPQGRDLETGAQPSTTLEGGGNKQPGWQLPIPKLEFPLFDWTDPKMWVIRCER